MVPDRGEAEDPADSEHGPHRALALPATDLDRRLADGRRHQHVEAVPAAVDLRRVGGRGAGRPARERPRVGAAEPAEAARARLEPLGVRDLADFVVDAAEVAGDEVVAREPERGLVAVDLVAERAQELLGLGEAGSGLVADLRRQDRPRGALGDRDPQPSGRRRRSVGERALGRRRPTGVAAAGRHGVEPERGVGDRPGHASRRRELVPVVVRLDRHPAALRLQPHQPAEGSGDPDRAAAVGGRGGAGEPGGDRPRAAAAGAAHRALRIPRVARLPPALGLGERQDRELREGGLRQDHGARGAQALDDLAVDRGGRVVVAARAEPGRGPLDVDVVLDRDRHPVQRRGVTGGAASVGGVRLGERPVGEHLGEDVEARVEAFDPVEIEPDELTRGDLPLADQLRLARGACVRELLAVHGPILLRPSSAAPRERDAEPGERQPAAEALEPHHPPALGVGDPGQLVVGVDDHRDPDRAEHGQVGDRVGVRVGDPEVDVVLVGELAHRLDLALAVHEGAAELAGEQAVLADLVAGPDAAVHVENPSEQLDELVARRRDDEGRAPGVLVGVDLLEHLRVDPRQHADQHLGCHSRDLARRDAVEDLLDLAEQLLGRLVGRAAHPKAHRIDPPTRHLAPADQPGLGRRPRPRQAGGPGDQGPVQIEERRCAASFSNVLPRARLRVHRGRVCRRPSDQKPPRTR